MERSSLNLRKLRKIANRRDIYDKLGSIAHPDMVMDEERTINEVLID